MSDRPTHCPFLNRTDSRCSDHFKLDHLQHAFKFCFGAYKTCPVYLELLLERRVRRMYAGGKESFHGGQSPAVSGHGASSRSTSSPRASRSTDTTINLPEARAFLLHLASERGLAENSLHAYRRDLEDIDRFFAPAGLTLLTAAADDFRNYLQDQTRQGQSHQDRRPPAGGDPGVPAVPLGRGPRRRRSASSSNSSNGPSPSSRCRKS